MAMRKTTFVKHGQKVDKDHIAEILASYFTKGKPQEYLKSVWERTNNTQNHGANHG
jgi:hypothetical protein